MSETDLKSIKERLELACMANDEWSEICASKDHVDEAHGMVGVRNKHGLPDGVHVFGDEGMTRNEALGMNAVLKKWINGKLSEEEVGDLIFDMSEMREVDFGYVFFNEPLWFYHKNYDASKAVEIMAKIKSHGTRSIFD